MDALIEIHDLAVNRNGRNVVLEIEHLAIREGEVLAVIGPNGAGKTTLLLTLGQLLKPTHGQICFRGKRLVAQDSLAFRRRIGLVLQAPLLLDATVFDNVATGLRFRGFPQAETKQRVDEWLERLGIAHLRRRPARRLSAGEAQRVSLARAFAIQPDLLLLDEPFSALDAPSRAQLLEDFQALVATTPVTVVFVTHDLGEALMLGERVAVLLEGRLRQVGPPEEVFSAPADPQVAAFVGVETVIPGRVETAEEGLLQVKCGDVCLKARGQAVPGQGVWFCLRPEEVSLVTSDDQPEQGAANCVLGKVQRTLPHGPMVKVVLDCGFPLVALVSHATARRMELSPGKKVTATFQASAVHLIPRAEQPHRI